MTEQEQRAAVVAEARSWLRTPFVQNARVKGCGVACGPLLVASYVPLWLDTGWPLPVLEPFPKDWHCHTRDERFLRVVEAFAREVDAPQQGDIVMFRLGGATRPYSHAAIVIEWPGRIIHAMWRSGVEYADVNQPPLRGAAVRFYSPWAAHA